MNRSAGMIWLVVSTAALCTAGCEKSAPLAAGPDHRETLDEPPVDASLDGVSPHISALAAQSQRDVDLLLGSPRPGAAEQSGDDAAESPLPGPRRGIVWNTPHQTDGTANPSTPAPTPGDEPDPSQSSSTEAANPPPTNTIGADRLRNLMVDLSRELYATGAYSATPLRELLTIAAMSMIDPERQLDPNAIPDLTDRERELLGKLQAFFAELGRNLDSPGRDTEQAIVEAVAKLRETLIKPPSLRIATAALCTRVEGFGDYSPFEKYTFLAGSQQRAIVYLEIDEFTSELNQKNEFVTHLGQQLTIYSDRDGIPVWREEWQPVIDRTKNRRQDFFTVQIIALPQALSVGRYQLKVRLRDEKSQAEAETSIAFEMVADPRMIGK